MTVTKVAMVNCLLVELQASDSQKHMWPWPSDSSMQTWSTMNKLIWIFEVQVRRTLSKADA